MMKLIGSRPAKRTSGSSTSTPDEEYEVVANAHSDVGAQIRDLEGFIDEAPQIQKRRKLETQVTLPPPEDDATQPGLTGISDDGTGHDDEAEDTQERYGRRHLDAMRRERRTNFYIFLLSAAAVSAFLYWVSLVVQ
ncbi:MAG: hypothetical protein ACR2RV_12915 [Verrucomicrobiales bacterium]